MGKPLGGSKSGFRVANVRDDRIDHRFYELSEIPVRVELHPVPAKAPPAAGR